MLSSRACPPGVEEVAGEGRCHVWSVVPQAQGYPTVSTLQRITNSNSHDISITFFFYTHFAPHNFVILKICIKLIFLDTKSQCCENVDHTSK